MLLRFPQVYVIAFALISTIGAHGQVETTDIAFAGPYRLYQCRAGEPDSLAQALQYVTTYTLDQIRTNVIADVQLGRKSSHGFSTFFKGRSAQRSVLRVFSTLLDGAVWSSPLRVKRLLTC